jgi:hypothetical protein
MKFLAFLLPLFITVVAAQCDTRDVWFPLPLLPPLTPLPLPTPIPIFRPYL